VSDNRGIINDRKKKSSGLRSELFDSQRSGPMNTGISQVSSTTVYLTPQHTVLMEHKYITGNSLDGW